MRTTPAEGTDFGLFGPGSVAWRLHREPALLVGGLRALMVQALHPLAIAAVADHSDYRADVWGRYARTTNYVVTTIFGTSSQAEALGARVREIHRPIRGVDAVTGRPYSADDPVLLLWIHTTLVESFLVSYRRFVRPLSAADADRYVAEMVRQAALVGLRPAEVPDTEAANQRFVDSRRPELMRTRTADEAVDTVLHPPLPRSRRPVWWVIGQAALALMPDHALELLDMRRNRTGEALASAVVRHGATRGVRLLRARPHPAVVQARERTESAGLRF